MTDDYSDSEDHRRCPVLILAENDASAGNAVRAAELIGVRSVRRLGWHEGATALARGPRAVLMLEAEQIDDETLHALLPSIVAAAVTLDAPIVLALGEQQIDLVAETMLGGRNQLLCAPSVAERVAAVLIAAECLDPVVLLEVTGENEAARLARLNEEVARIAEVLSRLTQRDSLPRAVVRADVADNRLSFETRTLDEPGIDAGEIRRVIRARRLREQFLGPGLFEDPAWDMLLDLYAAHLERAQVSVSSLCIAAAVAPTTALRWIGKMSDAGLFERQADPFDRRRVFMGLSSVALTGMHRFIAATQRAGLPIV